MSRYLSCLLDSTFPHSNPVVSRYFATAAQSLSSCPKRQSVRGRFTRTEANGQMPPHASAPGDSTTSSHPNAPAQTLHGPDAIQVSAARRTTPARRLIMTRTPRNPPRTKKLGIHSSHVIKAQPSHRSAHTRRTAEDIREEELLLVRHYVKRYKYLVVLVALDDYLGLKALGSGGPLLRPGSVWFTASCTENFFMRPVVNDRLYSGH